MRVYVQRRLERDIDGLNRMGFETLVEFRGRSRSPIAHDTFALCYSSGFGVCLY